MGTFTLDSWARQRLPAGGRLDFLRLDLEGAELPVLQASSEVLSHARLLQVEAHPDGSYKESSSTSVQAIRALLELISVRSQEVGGCCGPQLASCLTLAAEMRSL